jgi:hypothetical protein
MLTGFDLFDESEIAPEVSLEPWQHAAFEGVARGDILTLSNQKYEVVQKYDKYHVSVKKVGAKRKYFLLQHTNKVITAREEKGIWEETWKQPVVVECRFENYSKQ